MKKRVGLFCNKWVEFIAIILIGRTKRQFDIV